jgi:DNA polymerase I-like protein with 3'-5' exonuclease and polymerase domains
MLDYCIKDVMVSEKVYQVLEKRNLNATALQLEHDTYRITSEQTKIGWEFDLRKATKLMAVIKKELYDVEDEVRSVFVPIKEFLPLTDLKIKFRKDGKRSKAYVNQLAKGAYKHEDHGWGMDIYPEFNLGSRTQIAKHLQHYGWIPKEFTPTDKPIVNERVLRGIEIPQAQLINKYLMLQKRIGLISSWIEAVTIQGRIHGYVNSCGAVTGRMTHSKPNLAQVPSTHSEYGKECRELFKTKQGYKMVGVDASGLELRMLAHYLDDPEYTREILEGDIHTVNQKAAGLETRDQAKTFIYAFLYGAGEEKIGEIVGSGAKRGRSLKRAFLKNNPKLRDLRDSVKKAAKYGFIIGLDGRKVLIRSEHSALNALLQSAGAIVMKQALVYLVDYADNWNLTYNVVGNIHDEIQTEVLEIDAQKYGYLAVECIKKAGDTFNMKCPLDGEYKVGETWADTH